MMVKHYYPSRRIQRVARTQIFEAVFKTRFFQIWFKRVSVHGVVPVLIGAAVTASGYSEIYIRSLAVMACAIWLSIDVAIWLAEAKTEYKEVVFGLCCTAICSLGMGIMYWFLDSTLREQQKDVYQNMSARIELPSTGDVMNAYYVVSNGGKTRIGILDSCGVHLIVGKYGGLVGSLGVLSFTNGGSLGPGGEALSVQCFPGGMFGFVNPVGCADLELRVQYALETQPSDRRERFFRFVGHESDGQFVFVPEPPGGHDESKEQDRRYCGQYLPKPRPVDPKKEPPPETPSSVPSPKLPNKTKSIKNPLELIDFNSEQHISIANNGPVSVFVMDLLMKLKDPYVSMGHRLDVEIAPGKIVSQLYTDNTAIQHWSATHALADTWHEHYAKSVELYNSCGLGLVFFSPSDPGFQQIKNHYSGGARNLIFTDAEAVLHYRVSGGPETKEQTLPMVAITAVNRDGCPPGY